MNEDSKTTTAAILQETIERGVEAPLLLRGFRKRRRRYVHVRGDSVCSVSPSARKVRGREEYWLSVGLCVGFRSLAHLMARFENPAAGGPDEPCLMGTDLGHLMPGKRFLEWRILPSTDVQQLIHDVRDTLESYGLQFFEDYGDLDKCLAAWEQGVDFNLGRRRVLCLAAAYVQRNQSNRAMSLIESETRAARAEYDTTPAPSTLQWIRELERFRPFLEQHISGEGRRP